MTIALIGRPNVGKSSLFNRLIGRRNSIETAIPGTTRDRRAGILVWNGVTLRLIDTPGVVAAQSPNLQKENLILEHNVQEQATRAKKEADVILYIIDGKTGPVSEDYEIIKQLKKVRNKPVYLVVNKIDKPDEKVEAFKFKQLGLGEPIAVSAKNGRGTHELLNLLAKTGDKERVLPKTITTTIAIVGKPNVGKSSLFNALLKDEAVVVSPIPHTTRDYNETEIVYNDAKFTILDTAGLRKKSQIYKSTVIEIFSVKKTLECIKRADIVFLIIDVHEGITVQDQKIAHLIKENNVGLVIIANQWDLIENKNPSTLRQFQKTIYKTLRSFDWAPVVFTAVGNPQEAKIFGLERKYLRESSASENPLYKLLELSCAIQHSRTSYISCEVLKTILNNVLKQRPLPHGKASPKIYINALKQIGVKPPTFVIMVKSKILPPPHYVGFLKKELREYCNLWGVDIIIRVKQG